MSPPHTTDFAILFLPIESLYAEVLRRPGLMDVLQREHRVTIAGPTTLLAMLNSLHMGFRTLTLQQQAVHEARLAFVGDLAPAIEPALRAIGDVHLRARRDDGERRPVGAGALAQIGVVDGDDRRHLDVIGARRRQRAGAAG